MAQKNTFILRLFVRLAAIVGYLIFCIFVSGFAILRMMKIQYGDDDSAALGLVLFLNLFLAVPVCMLWGFLYFPILFRSDPKIKRNRVLFFWSASFLSGLSSILLFSCWIGRPFPNFTSNSATNAYILLIFFVSVLLFLAGILLRFRLSQEEKQRPPASFSKEH
jgi:hypothetical protein